MSHECFLGTSPFSNKSPFSVKTPEEMHDCLRQSPHISFPHEVPTLSASSSSTQKDEQNSITSPKMLNRPSSENVVDSEQSSDQRLSKLLELLNQAQTNGLA